MFETLDKLAMAGIGALTMTREKAEKIFEESVKRGEVARDARSGFVKDIMDSAENARKDLEKLISNEIKKTINSMDIATKEDISRIEDKIDKALKGK
ncbi:poly(hydroxyalkanoate) granule-associated protein [Limihaloglobus sulfuriphilus]|uniref:Poly(Hydroxyalkanoate) granule-associated protein n=1 Tax=Limihaloglobus sulfuriphilus TaxID=1851148 RepID=A0A1Q2MIL2_9BACT|nr:phasin family protein [Limihaloglobus sulfuriphilus]AQQ72358.1 poly(hydroxyalkanoate) granule-associated protein [Limihaloglobus sulfuriphilus]